MAEEYLTDDEQLEAVKRAFTEYAPWILGGVVLGVGGWFGIQYYRSHQNARAMQAAEQFSQMAAALQMNDAPKSLQIANGLIKNFPSSPYADQAQLTIARIDVDSGKAAEAVAPLTEVMNNSKDAELKQIARLRLARVLIDQGKPDDAIKTWRKAPPEDSPAVTTRCTATRFMPRRTFLAPLPNTTRRWAAATAAPMPPCCN